MTTSDTRMAISSAMPFQAAAAQPMAVPMAAPSRTAGQVDGERVPGADHGGEATSRPK